MKLFDELDDKNFLLYAAKHYYKPTAADAEEFYDDLNRFKYIKRLLSRYDQDDILQDRLLINHIVVIYNVFGISAANKMMWYKIDKKYWPIIKPILLYLNFITDKEKVEIPLDQNIVEKLRKT